MKKVVIAGAVRTAVGKFGGALKDVPAVELGALVVREAVERAGMSPSAVDEVIMGNAVQAGLGQNPTRQAAMKAGLSKEVPSFTVNHVCGSGLKAVVLAAQAIKAGDADCVVAGGMESMSGAPYLMKGSRWGLRLGHGELVDSLLQDGLTCAMSDFIPMGATAEHIAERYRLSRAEQDEFSALSQQRTEKAIKDGRFKDEIVPCLVPEKKVTIQFDTDEFPRFGTTVENLRTLKPAFKANGTVTAGNSSGINDGAAAMVVLSDSAAKTMGITPLATIIAYASSGVDPLLMGLGPVGAVQSVLKKSGLALSDIDLFEVNEAFAAEILGVLRELSIPLDRMNVNGGAIALGHPIGASGARVLATLLYEMKRRDLHRGLATLCIGGGQGIAMIVERP